MSRVYKQNQIILGQEKIVKIETSSIIKLNQNISLDINEEQISDNQSDEDIEVILCQAKDEASKILENAQLEAEKILSIANEEKEVIISEAYTKSNEILETARNQGYDEGLEKGRELGFNEVDSIIQEAKEIKENVLLEKKSMAKSLESEVIELIKSCVRKIIDHEIEKDHQLLLNLVKNGLEKCVYTDKLIIRVSANDYEIVDSFKNKIYLMTEGIDSIEIKKDPALKDGSIIIETTSGTVEASLQTQIAQIEQTFSDILKGE